MPVDEHRNVSEINLVKNERDSTALGQSKQWNESSKKNVSRRKIRRIRRLLRPEPKIDKKPRKNIKIIAYYVAVICFILVLLKNHEFRKELKRLAMNQFQLYLHGRENYCDEAFEHWHISNTLHHRIIGQGNALEVITSELQQHESITAMAFVGTHGVGKTLTLNLIEDSFQWHLNVHQYIWSLTESPHDQFNQLLKIINSLTTCGHNGVFIDNIPMKFINIIDEFNQKLLFHYKVKTIRFRQFNSEDIHNCKNMESDRLKIDIQPYQIDELLEDIDPKRHGCKLIAAKIVRLAFQDF